MHGAQEEQAQDWMSGDLRTGHQRNARAGSRDCKEAALAGGRAGRTRNRRGKPRTKKAM